MEVSTWFLDHWFDLIQTAGIIGSLLFTAYTIRKDERARGVGNSIAIAAQYREIWKEVFDHPRLLRVLVSEIDLKELPISDEETVFVFMVITHLSTVYRAMKLAEFVELEALQKDVRDFFSLPIPKAVWTKAKPFQNRDFALFMEMVLHPKLCDESAA